MSATYIGVRRIAAILIALGVFATDRFSKWMVESSLGEYDAKIVIPRFFNIVRSENPGIAFGIFQQNPSKIRTLILIVFSLAVLSLLASLLWRIERRDTVFAAGVALVFGGALGNLFDRIVFGQVTDFLDFYIGSYHWYTFNLSDAAICTGTGLLMLSPLVARAERAASF